MVCRCGFLKRGSKGITKTSNPRVADKICYRVSPHFTRLFAPRWTGLEDSPPFQTRLFDGTALPARRASSFLRESLLALRSAFSKCAASG